MRDRAYFLTGEPGIGKTTALKKIIDGLGVEYCGGFYTEEMRVADRRYGFRMVTLDGKVGTLANVADDLAPLKVGKYGVSLSFLEQTGMIAISCALASKSFVVIDEIGPMQLYSDLFKVAVLNALTSSVPLIGTIFAGSDPWSDALKQRNDVELYPLTSENRDEVPRLLIETLRKREAC